MTVEKVGIRERRPGRILGYMAIAAMAVSVCVDAQAALTSKSYIMDGLLVQYDGIENVGRGQPHDSTATTWADLSGSGLNMLIPVDSAFTNSSGLATLRAHGSGVVDGRIPEKDQKIRAAQRAAKYTILHMGGLGQRHPGCGQHEIRLGRHLAAGQGRHALLRVCA